MINVTTHGLDGNIHFDQNANPQAAQVIAVLELISGHIGQAFDSDSPSADASSAFDS